MQDTNNENTQSNRPEQPEAGDETMPTRIPREPVDLESTMPTRAAREPVEPESTVPTRVQRTPTQNNPAGPESTVKITVVRSVPESQQPPVGATQPMAATAPAQVDQLLETTRATAVGTGGKIPKDPGTGSRARRWPWILLGLLMILMLGGSGAWMGYQSALKLREQAYNTNKVELAKEHFMAGLVAQENKRYEVARLQFEAVIQLQPDFPGAQDKLREVLTAMMIAMTPTPPPTATPLPTMTPTKDLRPMEDIFNQVKQQYAVKDWDSMFATIDQIRTQDPTFHAVDIDGMLYFAYRFRGIDKILKQANLEGGLYDLALAERYGPLDADAKGYQNWARLYLNGASFWDVDWKKVVDYFEEIYPYFPNLRDSSGLTAVERYRQAAKNYAEQLSALGDNCGATDYYGKSLNAGADAGVAPKATEAELACHPPTQTPEPTIAPTETVPVAETPVPAEPTVETTQPPANPAGDPAATQQPANP